VNNRLHKLIAHFLLAAMLVNAVGSASASIFQKSVLLCTSLGYEWVTVEEETNSSSLMSHCDVCITSFSDDDSEIEAFYVADLPVQIQTKLKSDISLKRFNSQYLIAQGRAPPVYLLAI